MQSTSNSFKCNHFFGENCVLQELLAQCDHGFDFVRIMGTKKKKKKSAQTDIVVCFHRLLPNVHVRPFSARQTDRHTQTHTDTHLTIMPKELTTKTPDAPTN